MKRHYLYLILSLCLFIFCFYNWRYSPFLPHIDRNSDGSFTINGQTYIEYSEVDFMEKYQHLTRGDKIAIINKTDDFPWCTVYEAQGTSDQVLLVHEEVIMSIDTYYVIE